MTGQDPQILVDRGSAPDGSALALMRIPFAFVQDRLLDTRSFISEANDRGYQVTLDDLRALHNHRLLLPLYRVSDTPVTGRAIDLPEIAASNPRGWAMAAAHSGKLRDCADEGYSAAWPYEAPRPPVSPGDERWWNGFLYSQWQLPELQHALNDYRALQWGWRWSADTRLADRDRRRTLALVALSTRYLPGVTGVIRSAGGEAHDDAWRFAHQVGVRELLNLSGFDPAQLKPQAETLLLQAGSRDPMIKWWPLIRQTGDRGWSKLRGAPLDCVWQRIAAEVMLRAHEELAESGDLDPLPDLTAVRFHSALHDRVTPRHDDAESLERALATLGLSPHPRVLLLVEGDTEMVHITQLLDQLGLNRPDQVRLQNCRGSDVNPQLITRYAVAPRLGPRRGGAQTVDVPPTALVVAMDPENRWRTEELRRIEKRRLMEAIRQEVQHQGGTISESDLQHLIHIFVWGQDSYELANFTDDELVSAVTRLAREQARGAADDRGWDETLRLAIAEARAQHRDIQAAIGPLRIREDKVRLAHILWPSLADKYQEELAVADVRTPVLQLMEDVRRLVNQLPTTSYVLQDSRDE